MLGKYACGILDGHLEAGEGHHLGTERAMDIEERGAPEGSGSGHEQLEKW
jgi:hypothetical protein